jgi:hypothetical protein
MGVTVMAMTMPRMFVGVVVVAPRVIMLVVMRIFAVVVRRGGRASQLVAGSILVVGMFVHLLYATRHKGVAPPWQLTTQRGPRRLAIRRFWASRADSGCAAKRRFVDSKDQKKAGGMTLETAARCVVAAGPD